MFFYARSGKPNADIHIHLTTEKAKGTLFIDTAKPFTSINSRCKDISNMLSMPTKATKINTANINVSSLPTSLKKVVLTYLTKELYSFNKYKKGATDNETITKIFFVDTSATTENINHVLFAIQCTNFARDMENEPANLMSPEVFCLRAKNILKNKATVKVLGIKEMEKEGLNLVLAIGRSSPRQPRFLIAEMINNPQKPTICIVGKTVVYDAGGLNIKLKSMTPEMKTDKTGGCIAISIMKFFAKYACDCNLVVICPVVENLLSKNATRPGDVIKAHNGKMVEITDTDAEGRLILADALSFSAKYNPKYIIDFATLTGWADSVHPDLNAVCWTKELTTASLVNQVGEEVGERIWFLPPWDEYTEYAQSNIANVKNHTDNIATGAYFPVMFMLHFLPDHLKSKYIHFDVCHNWKKNLARGNCVMLGIELIKRLSKE